MLLKFLLVLIVVPLSILYYHLTKNIPLPILEDTWWGPGESGNDTIDIKPFKIEISDEILQDLQERLNTSRPITPALTGTKHHYGINSQLVNEVLDFWKNKYDWREREEIINKFPHFKTQIQGLYIHYLHVKPQNAKGLKVLPLLILHGWPSTFREFYDIIPMLTTPQPGRNFVFEVIVGSLPGYGFSDAAVKPGLGAIQMAVLFKNLMERLGFQKYYIQGGDWGGIICSHMATLYKDRVLGIHSNFCIVSTPISYLKMLIGAVIPRLIVDEKNERKIYPLSTMLYYLIRECGYLHIQATKPDTVGVALNDSPIGLAAYMLEKIIYVTNPDGTNIIHGNLHAKLKYENLLDNIMIYWVTNSMTTAARIYAESFNIAQFSMNLERMPIIVPSACVNFPHEMIYFPESLLLEKFANLVQITDIEGDEGGHLAALEMPKELADDIWSAVDKMEKSDYNKLRSN